MELEKTIGDIAQSQELIQKDLTEIKIVLKGYDGTAGLVKQVQNNTRAVNKIWIVIAVLVATAGGGSYGLVQFVLNMVK